VRAPSIALVVAIGAALVVTSPASGQPAGVHLVGLLLSTSPVAASHVLDAFHDSLRERG
jgi:hypothetical protein